MIYNSDCLKKLEEFKDNSIESLCTDPPAGISFMNKEWDHHKGGRDEWIKWMTSIMQECFRVLKPGAHGLVWALPRTSHWTATALEDAGFEVRDIINHIFGTGFPKSLDISKAIDKEAGAKREITGKKSTYREPQSPNGWDCTKRAEFETAPSTDAAKQWQGFGTALKPACEHWILVRKPCSEKTVAKNVLKWGVGGLNIDGCRIGTETITQHKRDFTGIHGNKYGPGVKQPVLGQTSTTQGRFPANLTFDEVAAEMLDEQSAPQMHSAGAARKAIRNCANKGMFNLPGDGNRFGDSGGASRFFYVAKASKSERGKDNSHPTVKSLKLMEYLIKLITPPKGTVLDPFMGSGSTGVAAKNLGFNFIGIEKEKEYFEIAKARLK